MIHELKTRYGTMFVPDTETAQYGWLSSSGASDEDEDICMVIDLLKERPRGFVVDAGASFGCWTLAMAPYANAGHGIRAAGSGLPVAVAICAAKWSVERHSPVRCARSGFVRKHA